MNPNKLNLDPDPESCPNLDPDQGLMKGKNQCCGAGAEIKFLINIFCSQFGGCYDEDKLISTSISIVPVLPVPF